MAEGRRQITRPRVSRRAKLKIAVLVLVVLAVGFGGLRLWTTLRGVTAEAGLARDELLAGARVVKAGTAGLTKEQDASAGAYFRSAEAHFVHIHAVLTEGRTIRAVSWLPWVNTQVQAANDLSDMGVHLSRTGVLGLQVIRAALDQVPPGSAAHEDPGQKILETLRTIDPKIGEISAELDLAIADRARIPSSGLLPQLQNAMVQLDGRVDIRGLRDSVKSLHAQEPAIRRLLGASGAQTYLVLQQDPAELRATGGFIGSVGFLSFDHGKMAPFDPVDVVSVDRNAQGVTLGFGSASTDVPVPAPLASAFHLNSLTLRDSNWSPDFPTSARQAEDLLQREAGRKVDGVIAIDPYFIGRVLTLTGPITVPETGDVVDSANFFATTLNRVELNAAPARKSFLAYASKAILTRLLTLPSSQWFPLLQVLGWGCDSRSLQASFHDASMEDLVNHFQCGGQVKPIRGDGLLVIVSNLGANKDDFWLKRKYSVEIAMTAKGTARHTLRMHFYDLTRQDPRLTQYLPYAGWLRVYLPASSSIVSTDGAQLDLADDLGRPVLQGWFYVDFNKSTDISIVYDVGAATMRSQNHEFEFFWQKQAGRPADAITIGFTPPPGSKLEAIHVGADPTPAKSVTTDLSVDRQFIFDYGPS